MTSRPRIHRPLSRADPMKKYLAISFLAATPFFAAAQQRPPVQVQDPVQRTPLAIEKAMAQAEAQQAAHIKAGPKTGLDIKELDQMKGVDPQQLAAKYQQAGVGHAPAVQELLIFISTSIPQKALVMLGEQAKVTGATLVMRGMVAPLGTKQAMQKTMEALQPVAATGAKIQIDPEAFGRYNIKAVPTFVIATKDESCATEQCDTKSFALTGDVTLEYALEQWSNRGGPIGKQADKYLQLLERAKQ